MGEARGPASGDFSDPENSGLPRTGYCCSHILPAFPGRTWYRSVAPSWDWLWPGGKRGVGSPPPWCPQVPAHSWSWGGHVGALSTPTLPIWGNKAGGKSGTEAMVWPGTARAGWLASAGGGGGEFWPMSQRLETSDLRNQRNWAGSLAETKSCPKFISTLRAPSKMNGWKLQFPFSTSGTYIPR